MSHLTTRLHRHGGLVRLVADDVLRAQLARPQPKCLRDRLLAESVHRAWLFADTTTFADTWIQAGLGQDATETLLRWCAAQRESRQLQLPGEIGARLDPALRNEIAWLLAAWDADGVIPVAGDGSDGLAAAVLLPFRVRESAGPHHRGATGRDGLACGVDFEDAVRTANRLAQEQGWSPAEAWFSIELTTIDGSVDLPVRGRSAGLPVLLARVFQSSGISVAAFAFAASGSLAEGPGIRLAQDGAAVLHETKATLLRRLGVPCVVLPGAGTNPWPSGEDLTLRVHELVESLRPAAAPNPHDRLQQSLRKHADSLHYGHASPRLVLRLTTNLLERDLATPDLRLSQLRAEALLVQGSAWTHLGEPLRAQEAVEEALRCSRQVAPEWAWQALVRQAVILQDLGDYRAAIDLCRNVRDRCAALPTTDSVLDVALRASGTLGQTLTCLGLCPGEDQAAREGLEALRRARALAREMDVRRPAADTAEEPRNAAYVAWWHALHAPNEAAAPWSEAWECAARLDPGGSTGQYLHRTHWLAVYRAVLRSLPIPDATVVAAEELPLPEEGWLRATALKYRATLRASQGKVPEAIQDFDDAIRLLATSPETPGLLDFIGATAAVQAWTSLRELAPEAAERFRDQARTAIRRAEDRQPWFPGTPFAGSAWLRWLEGTSVETTSFPQHCFPY